MCLDPASSSKFYSLIKFGRDFDKSWKEYDVLIVILLGVLYIGLLYGLIVILIRGSDSGFILILGGCKFYDKDKPNW